MVDRKYFLAARERRPSIAAAVSCLNPSPAASLCFGFSDFSFSAFLCLMKTLLALILSALVALTIVPAVTARIPEDQIKSAGAIPLNTELLDKLDKAAKAARADEAARTEMASVKETERDPVIAAINSKCPKTVAYLKEAGVTANQLMDATVAI